MDNLPKDPIMLLSVINMKLRDFYCSLDALCEDTNIDRNDIEERLGNIGFTYDVTTNQFK